MELVGWNKAEPEVPHQVGIILQRQQDSLVVLQKNERQLDSSTKGMKCLRAEGQSADAERTNAKENSMFGLNSSSA